MSDSLRQALARRPDCPTLEELIEASAAFEEHLGHCHACRAELALFRNFEAGEPAPDERGAVRFIVAQLGQLTAPPARETFWQRLFTPRWLGGMALAAAALLVAVGLSSQWRLGHTSAPATEDGALRSTAVRITSPTGDLNQLPPAIEWRPVPGAVSYAIPCREVDGKVILNTYITSSPLILREPVNKLLVPGKKVLLEVVANDGAGIPLARSGQVGIRLQSKATQTH